MGLNMNDISYIDANGNRITVGTNTPLPVTGGGGGGGGTTSTVSINDGNTANIVGSSTTAPTGTERGLLVRTIPSGLPNAQNLTQVLGSPLSASNPLLTALIVSGAAVSTGNPIPVAQASSLPAGTNAIGTVGINAALPTGTNNIGNTGNIGLGVTGTHAALSSVVDGTTDLSNMGQVTVQITGTFSGTITFQVSIDGTNWSTKSMASAAYGALVSSATGSGTWSAYIGARYFRTIATAYTSGTATVNIRYNSQTVQMPASTTLRSSYGSDAVANTNMDGIGISALNSSAGVDRLRTAGGLVASTPAASATNLGLAVAAGGNVLGSIAAATAVGAGTSYDNTLSRIAHTIQVDVTTTTAGTAGTHTVTLQGSLDNSNWTTLATVTPASTSTTSSDTSNHANASVGNLPYRYIRANWTAAPTSWAGTLTARVTSA